MRDQLRRLHELAGSPTKDRLKEHADGRGHSVSRAALAAVTVDGDSEPRWATVEAFIDACTAYAAARKRPLPPQEVDMLVWKTSYDRTHPGPRMDRPPATRPTPESVGPWNPSRTVAEWDAFHLGVHRAITTDDAGSGQALPELTPYVLRAHDRRLRELLAAPTQPVMVVLVGTSSTGKTRAAFEAVRECLPGWALLRPVDAAELIDQIRGGAVGPRTVLWLNETQTYLRDRPEVAASLRRLITGGQPVAVVGTMWPQHWKALTAVPTVDPSDAHAQARELLFQGTIRVDVPEGFTGEDLAELLRKRGTDRRLDIAVEAAGGGRKVIQVLAGGPALVHRYEHPADAEDRYGLATVTAAMDIHRLGHESPTGKVLLAEVATVYLDEQDRIDAPAGWADTGLIHACQEVYGIAALTARRDQPGAGPADGYELHDYLIQYARTTRGGVLVSAAVWDVLTAGTANVTDRIRLARQAEQRGLYRHAVGLARPAAEAGDTAAMNILAGRLDGAGRTEEAEQWWRRAAEAGDPTAVHMAAKRLDEAGRGEEAERLLRRFAEAGDSSAVLALVGRLDGVDRGEDAERLLRRFAEAGDTVVMERLSARLYEADRGEEAEQWLRRAAPRKPVTPSRWTSSPGGSTRPAAARKPNNGGAAS
jgi:hypothetical protein